MEVAEAVSCFTDEQLHIIPQHVRGQGVSAVAVEFQASPSCETQVELPLSGRFVGKCYKVQGQAGDPPAVALHEFQMLQAAQSCPNVLQTFGLFRVPSLSQMPGFDSKVADQKHCVLLMENCDYSLQDFDFFRFTESEAAFICRSVLTALCYLHNMKMVHRDVKPGNILLKDGGGRVVLGDFGLASWLQDKETVPNNGCGTHGFLAPECLQRKEFCKASDLFAVGSVLYQLLFRTFAFVRDSDVKTDIATYLGDLPLIPCGRPVGKSEEACHLIRWLLEANPSDRPTAASALDHVWFRKVVDTKVTLKTFLAEQHLRSEDGLEEWPVVRHQALRRSEQESSPSVQASTRSRARKWPSTARKILFGLGQSVRRRFWARNDRKVMPEFSVIVVPPAT